MKRILLITTLASFLFASSSDEVLMSSYAAACQTDIQIKQKDELGSDTQKITEACNLCVKNLVIPVSKNEENIIFMTKQCVSEYKKRN